MIGGGMRRRKLLVALAGLAVVVAGVVVLWPRSASRITRENFERVHPGMSFQEVKAILGMPQAVSDGSKALASHGNYPGGSEWKIAQSSRDKASENVCDWYEDDYGIRVTFSASLRATSGEWFPPAPQDPIERLRCQAERQWHRWFP
jgi:hypothetical protein